MKRYSIETLIMDEGNSFYVVDSMQVDNDEYYVHLTKVEVNAVRLESFLNNLDTAFKQAVDDVLDLI